MKQAYSAKLSRDAREYLSAHGSRWSPGTRKDMEKRFRQFEEWLRNRRLKLYQLDAIALAEYCGQPVDSAPARRKLVLLRDYLMWCHARSIRNPDPKLLFPGYLRRRPYLLPPLLKEYVDSVMSGWNSASRQQARLSVSYFHRAMAERGFALSDLTRDHYNTCYQWLRHAFVEVIRDLTTSERIHLHRLRHTFATEMLSAGMSLYGTMHILGHRHAGTTLIYAAIVQATVREEYFAAIEKLKGQSSRQPR